MRVCFLQKHTSVNGLLTTSHTSILKMKKILSIILATCLLCGLSCTKDFTEINTNPNAPLGVQPSLLLRQVIYNYGDEMAYEGFTAGNLLGQHFTMVDFNLFDRHNLSSPQVGGNPWPVIYRNLRDNELILDKARTEPTAAVYEGPALILKAYMAATLTDIYGDVPYFDALRGQEGTVTPKYDAQEMIYTAEGGILDNLRKGIAAIDNYTGVAALEGDIFYGGDLSAWRKLGNSLLLKYLLRISDRTEAGAEMTEIYNSGDFIAANAENAIFNFTDGLPNNFRMANLRDGDFNLFIMSETIEEILKVNDDPRIGTFFRPIQNEELEEDFRGFLNGPDASATSISIADYSLTGTVFRQETGRLDANFMTAAEVHFILAEAAEAGFLSASAEDLYNAGVQLSFDYWGTPLPSDYLTAGAAAYGSNGADRTEQIITQKWLHNSINGYEGWIEWRRTGFPQLKTVAASLNDDLIPVRMPYPPDEQALNAANYQAAIGAEGNSVNRRTWWDAE